MNGKEHVASGTFVVRCSCLDAAAAPDEIKNLEKQVFRACVDDRIANDLLGRFYGVDLTTI